jgi:hypothetical protein
MSWIFDIGPLCDEKLTSGNLTISNAGFYRTLVEPRIFIALGAKPLA